MTPSESNRTTEFYQLNFVAIRTDPQHHFYAVDVQVIQQRGHSCAGRRLANYRYNFSPSIRHAAPQQPKPNPRGAPTPQHKEKGGTPPPVSRRRSAMSTVRDGYPACLSLELLGAISEALGSGANVNPLSRANRSLHEQLTPYLYRRNAHRVGTRILGPAVGR